MFKHRRKQRRHSFLDHKIGLNSVEKYFREIGSFSGVTRGHVVIFLTNTMRKMAGLRERVNGK